MENIDQLLPNSKQANAQYLKLIYNSVGCLPLYAHIYMSLFGPCLSSLIAILLTLAQLFAIFLLSLFIYV